MTPRLPWPLLALFSCSSQASAPPASVSVPPGAVGICAGKGLSPDAVRRVAIAQQLPPRAAAEALAHDARFAAEAELRGVAALPPVRLAHDALLARALLARLREENAAPPTPAEVRALRQERWRDFDRPEGVRVIHAVALGQGQQAARLVADALRQASAEARSAEDFEARTKNVPHEGVEVRVERLPLMAQDGRNLEGEESFDAAFAGAAFSLKKAGDLSPVVPTPFGFHVIFLLERSSAFQPSDEQIAAVAREEILARRTAAAKLSLLEALRKEREPLIARNFVELTSPLHGRPAGR